MICNFDKWPQNYLIKYTPLFQACCLVFSRNMYKDLLDRAGEMSVVLIFDICNVYEIVAYDWLYSQYSCGRYGAEISRKHRRLAFVLAYQG